MVKHQLGLRFLAITLTFCVGLVVSYLPAVFVRPSVGQTEEVAGVLVPAQVTYQLPLAPQLPLSPGWYMLYDQPPPPEFDIYAPVEEPTPDPHSVEINCLFLVVSVDAQRRLMLNESEAGTLDQPEQLTNLLTQVFKERQVARAYKPGIELRADLPMSARTPKTVFVEPDAALTYGDVLRLLSLLRQTGAEPIALRVRDLDQSRRPVLYLPPQN